MIISDLNYLESITEASSIEGAGQSVDQSAKVVTTQYAVAAAGNQFGKKNIAIGNTALALNINVPTVTQVGGNLKLW